MKINLAKSTGFCFGVRRALKIAYDTVKLSATVEMLGDIVHNEEVVKDIDKIGIKKIVKLKIGRNKLLLIRAHGVGEKTIKKASALGYKIIDATCPMVKEIHKIAIEMEKKGYTIIIIGDKKHDEVQGIIGQLKKKAIAIDAVNPLPLNKLRKIKKAAVIVQSTQNYDRVTKIIGIIFLLLKY